MRAAVLAALVLAGPAVIGRAGPLASLQDAAQDAAAAASSFDGARRIATAPQADEGAALTRPPSPAARSARSFEDSKTLGVPDIGGPPSRGAWDTTRKAALTLGILAALAGGVLYFFSPGFLVLLGVGLLLIIAADHLPSSQS